MSIVSTSARMVSSGEESREMRPYGRCRPAPTAASRSPCSSGSGRRVMASCGTPNAVAVITVPEPPWCTITSQVSSSMCSGTDSAGRTFAGRSPSTSSWAAVVTTSTSASRSASARTVLPNISRPSGPSNRSVVSPQVTQTRRRAGLSSAQSGIVPGPL